MTNKAKIFFGSSSEAKEDLRILSRQVCHEDWAVPVLWSREGFPPGRSYLDSLLKQSREVQFAVFLCRGDDVVDSRSVRSMAPRDNVIFEIGMFVRALGPEAVLLVVPETNPPVKIPSDYAGFPSIRYESGSVPEEYLRQPAEEVRARLRGSWQPTSTPPTALRPAHVQYYPSFQGHTVAIYCDLNAPRDWFQEFGTAVRGARAFLNSRMLYFGPGLADNWFRVNNDFDANRELHAAFMGQFLPLLSEIHPEELRIVDLGVGDFKKGNEILQHYLGDRDLKLDYFPLDISDEMLKKAADPKKWPAIDEVLKRAGKVIALNTTFDELPKYSYLFQSSARAQTLFLLLGNTLGNELQEAETLSVIRDAMGDNDVLMAELQLAEDKPFSGGEAANQNQPNKYFYTGPFEILSGDPDTIDLIVERKDERRAFTYEFYAQLRSPLSVRHPALPRFSLPKGKKVGVYIVRKYRGAAEVEAMFVEAGFRIMRVRSTVASGPRDRLFCCLTARK